MTQFSYNIFTFNCVVFHLGLGPERERQRERQREREGGDNANRKDFLEQLDLSYYRCERLLSQILPSGYCQYYILFGGRNEHKFMINTRKK